VIQENKTYFVSSRLHWPQWCGRRGTYSYFLPNKLHNYPWG